MKKDIFTVWIKEFCSLVFTQAVQAFLLAIIMSVILSTASGNTVSDQNIAVSATGVIAIIALTAISKIELLVKKIFGIESQFGDPSMKNGAAGLAGTLIGASLAKRVLNNAGKIGGGAMDVAKARKARAVANRNLANDLSRLNAANATPSTGGSTGGSTSGGGTTGGSGGESSGSGGASSSSGGGSGGQNVTLTPNNVTLNTSDAKIDSKNSTTTSNNLSVNAGNVNVDGKNSTADKKAEIMEKYQNAIDAAKEQRRQGVYKTLSGGAETIGGIAGGTAGAIVGMASGDGIARNAGTGMGVGDYIGQSAVQTVKTVHEKEIIREQVRTEKDRATSAVSSLTGKDIDSYRSAVRELERYTSRLGDVTQEAGRKTDAGNI